MLISRCGIEPRRKFARGRASHRGALPIDRIVRAGARCGKPRRYDSDFIKWTPRFMRLWSQEIRVTGDQVKPGASRSTLEERARHQCHLPDALSTWTKAARSNQMLGSRWRGRHRRHCGNSERLECAAEFFPDAAWQRCVVHWYRNIFSHVPSNKVRDIAAMLKAIHAGEDIAAARQKALQVIEKLRGLRLTKAAEIVETAVHETLAYYTFPEEHWRRIRTNNPLERILREIRRRTRVVGAFPDGQSALNLAAARLRHIAGTAWSTKRYLNIELLKEQNMRGAITA
jgi:hypothetical protein